MHLGKTCQWEHEVEESCLPHSKQEAERERDIDRERDRERPATGTRYTQGPALSWGPNSQYMNLLGETSYTNHSD
jgi:hypothetical protein